MVAFTTAAAWIVVVLVCAISSGVATAKDADNVRSVAIEYASLATHPTADCTKIHLYLKNLSADPVTVEGVCLGDRFLDLNPVYPDGRSFSGTGWSKEDGAPLSVTVVVHGHNGGTQRATIWHADSAVQWYRALPNPITPGRIGAVTVSLWDTVKAGETVCALHRIEGTIANSGKDSEQKRSARAFAYMDMGLDEDAFAVCQRFCRGHEAEVAVTAWKKLSSLVLEKGS
jgi:hypothetical protein